MKKVEGPGTGRALSSSMIRLVQLTLAFALLSILTGCSTVSDLVVTNIPDGKEGRAKIVVNLRKQTADLYKGKTKVAESRISTGREGKATPTGSFRVIRKDEDHRSSLYGSYVNGWGRVVVPNVDVRKKAKPAQTHFEGASMPFFIEFRPGYGLHAGYLPGYPASHGCVRMPFWKARQFYNAARVGTQVVIRG